MFKQKKFFRYTFLQFLIEDEPVFLSFLIYFTNYKLDYFVL